MKVTGRALRMANPPSGNARVRDNIQPNNQFRSKESRLKGPAERLETAQRTGSRIAARLVLITHGKLFPNWLRFPLDPA